MANVTCSVNGCDQQRYKRDWCNRHYLRWRRHGDPLGGGALRGVETNCAAKACTDPAIAGGLCKIHYERRRTHGDPNATVRVVRRGVPAHDRVMAMSHPVAGGCRIFTGPLNHAGYGRVKVDGRTVGAHRVVLIHHRGLLAGMEAMHSCDTPACVEVTHLSWGTHAENMADAVAKGRMKP